LEVQLNPPLIGVTTYRNQNSSGFTQFSVAEAYVSALSNAGASPILIPLGGSLVTLDVLLSHLDGLLFSGGGDIHPHAYSSRMHARVSEVDRDRDRVELHLLDRAISMRLPFLGICRGFQLINVGLGGSLYEDILDQHEGALQHQTSQDRPRDHLAHHVKIDADSSLGCILGAAELSVNSMHHQGVRQLAPELRATALAPDGIIEGFEYIGYPFGLGVQWHPEWLQAYSPMRALFSAFVEACK
jgi:putative glutamine amidotransferase